jgi:hypothetical protein
MTGKGKGKGKSTKRIKKTTIPEPQQAPPETEGQGQGQGQQREPLMGAQSLGFTCDKCGGVFVTEFELDHHDKTDH